MTQNKEDLLQKSTLVRKRIIEDMSDGVVLIGNNGIIRLVNPSALAIFDKKEEDLKGKSFAACFFEESMNDDFTQTVLDAVYEGGKEHVNFVPYYNGTDMKQLRVMTSFLKDNGEKVGVIAVISDMTEVFELRDAVTAMRRIEKLNQQLEIRNELLRDTFGRYLSDDIVKEIMEKPDGLKMGGQKRVITIMMSDLRGFTAMCERMEAEDLTNSLNHYFREMYEEISRYRGTLIEFLGDGLFVIFGAPVESKSHASDAVAAAIGMQQRMAEVNRWNKEHGYEELAMGIGINTGEVVVGNIGSDKRTKYGVMGPNVNLAGRVESYTTEGQILISPSTRDAIREELVIKSSFQAMPKGVKKEITISNVIGIGGSYQRYLTEEEDSMSLLENPVNVLYHAIEGKHVSRDERQAVICAISEHGAMMEIAEDLKEFDNIVLEIGAELYCKITEKKEDRYLITFTARPANFNDWYASLF